MKRLKSPERIKRIDVLEQLYDVLFGVKHRVVKPGSDVSETKQVKVDYESLKVESRAVGALVFWVERFSTNPTNAGGCAPWRAG